MNQLKQLAKAHRHKCDKNKRSESKTSGDQNNKKAIRVPQSKSEYDQEQSVVRKVVDPETGRTRLVKGSGEIIEEVVSKEKQREINRMATLTDGLSYQAAQLTGKYAS
ncbi:hypothetical protein INT43_000135 [Umbelopsis isabellina]|uniref:ADP-ribosylation factor-like protein 6-interacting protein 4 n=1 Tax=Mortierella isabellina TaxID=91625 RepID=A0A8H7PF59_MORIS|nr:hypothetical protein INT43_000135 [Umbelopsis isabellina]